MAPKNKFYKTFYTKTEFDNYISNLMVEYIARYMEPIKKDAVYRGIDTGTTYGVDMATIALGRLIGEQETFPDFVMSFLKKIEEASNDYCDLFDIDILENNDQELWWSGAKLDQELKSYVGDIYPPFQERYKFKEEKSD